MENKLKLIYNTYANMNVEIQRSPVESADDPQR